VVLFQIRELHRLYWTQKNLMRELHRRELEAKEHRETVPPQSFAVRKIALLMDFDFCS